MIKANINKENKQQVITATGSIEEMMADTAILINGIYNQLKNADPTTARIFRTGITNMVKDATGPVWKPMDGQTGIVFSIPKED